MIEELVELGHSLQARRPFVGKPAPLVEEGHTVGPVDVKGFADKRRSRHRVAPTVAAVVEGARAGKTPVVPWYTNKYMSNPTCRGYPWY